RGFRTRGHNLVWPGAVNLPQSINDLLGEGSLDATEQQALRDAITARIAEMGAATSGKITSWDVVNEPRSNRDLLDALDEGDAAMADWFQLAAAADPNARLYVNDFGILTSGGGTDTQNQQLLESQAQDLLDAGAPIDGVGLQGHFSDDNLTGPEQLWAIVDRYADMGLDVHVTEFDHNSTDEALQAAYLRDFYTAMFAHEGVSEISMWGFWENAHWLDDAALYRSDWSIKPNGEAYSDLVYGEWWTEEDAATDAAGEATVRAFKGQHDVTAERAGQQVAANATLTDGGTTLVVTLDTLVGDYNGDGTVDAADYTMWRDAYGTAVTQNGEGADGNADGVVNEADLALWRDAFGATMPTNAPPVPEPTGVAILVGLAFTRLAGGRVRTPREGSAR
ncbi:MAG: endo-1,4-beta-xylanase, partial [Planctomycetota bacterium]